MRVGADDGVRERDTVPHLDDAREVLKVDLVDDAGIRGHDPEVVEGALAPAEEGIALLVPLELELDVPLDRQMRCELVDLDGMVDDELDRDERVDGARGAALVAHRVAHGGEVDDGGYAGEVLQQHARRVERDLLRRLGVCDPAGDCFDAFLGAGSEHVLEQDPERVREPGCGGVELVEPVTLGTDP